jgi:PAB1-binding protein PBP1
MATTETGTKSKSLSRSGKLNTMNKVDGIPNVLCTEINEELGISVRKVTDRMLMGDKCVKTAANHTYLGHKYNMFSKSKKVGLFSPAHGRGFPV